MRIAILGQQKFGRAVLEAFLHRQDIVAGVFCAPEKPGAPPDELRLAAEQRSIATFLLPSLKTEAARSALRELAVDVAVMAYVLQFVPQEFSSIPRFGTIQYHPSLLPRYRGPSAVNWPIIRGDTQTGLTIFRPTDGLDEGPVILQKHIAIGPDDTLGQIYFDRLFPLGIDALLEASQLVASGSAESIVQDETEATYEGWCREAEAQINWHTHVDQIYNLIRGCNPAPAAWTTLAGGKLQLFDARKHHTRRFAQIKGPLGAITAVGPDSISISAHGGQIEVFKMRHQKGEKMSAPRVCAAAGLDVGAILGK